MHLYFSSPYAYNFGLGKRAEDLSNYDDEAAFYTDTNNNVKAGLNQETWENGGFSDNKNDIDVIDYDFQYPKGLNTHFRELKFTQ